MPLGIGLMAVGYGIAAVAPNIYVAVPAVVLASFGNGAAVVCNALFVQRGAPDELRGRAFTVIMSSNYALLGVGMVAAGALTDAFGARWVWGGGGGGVPRRRPCSRSRSLHAARGDGVSHAPGLDARRARRRGPRAATGGRSHGRSAWSRTATRSRTSWSGSSTRRPAPPMSSASPARPESASRR